MFWKFNGGSGFGLYRLVPRFVPSLTLCHRNCLFLQQDDSLEKRVQALESGAKFEATKEEVQKVEQEYLLKLREIRAALTAGGNVTSSATTKELEALRKENEELKKQNTKLEYRVNHMVHSMETLYAAANPKP